MAKKIEYTVIRGRKIIPIHSLNKGTCRKYSNCLSGTFQHRNVTSSMFCVWGKWKRRSSTHDWLKKPETVIYQTRAGEVKAQRCLYASEIKDDVLHAIGGMGLHNYDPEIEGFVGKFADVTYKNTHTALGYKQGEFLGVYFPNATSLQIRYIMMEVLECEFAILLDGGHIAAINTPQTRVNLGQLQNNMIQFIV